MCDKQQILAMLQDKDHKKAHDFAQEMIAESALSDAYYFCFEDIAALLTAKSSYVRTRAFALCCAQARWDTAGRLRTALPAMLSLLADEKPTVVRQCLAALHEVALFRPELSAAIASAVWEIPVDRYKDSMAPLIRKDRDELLMLLEG